jgi:riboflavin kinase/FMN adenylyltransferase
MKIINIAHPHDYHRGDFPPLAAALGYFDGVHIGHQKVIETAKQIGEEKGLASAVMTFDPHPSVILNKHIKHVRLLTPLQDKIDLMENMGLDYLFIVQFTPDFSHLSPQQFVDDYLISLNIKHVVAGFDYSYGQYGKGTMENLPLHSRGEFDVTTVSKQDFGDEKISSSRIREELINGHTETIHQLLSRHFSVKGCIVDGEKRGRLLGFPTANIKVDPDYYLPGTGVYCVRMNVRDHWYNGICNVGYKPTFHMEKEEIPTVEVHLLDFEDDIYKERVIVEWHKRIRSEQRFGSVDDLVAQLENDKKFAIEYFG